MGRIIEILKEFQNNSQSIFLPYLVEKFSLTIRTLQKDIQRINVLLSEISDCKIIKRKDQLMIVGFNPKEAINKLLKKLSKSSNNNSAKIYQLLLYFIWELTPTPTNKLIEFTSSDLHSLNQKLNLINSFFQYYQLNIRLKFKTKKGWILNGCEKDLRFLATNILINNPSYPNYLDSSLFNLYDKLNIILSHNNFYNYYSHEIIYFLLVMVKRIKINKLLNSYYSQFLLNSFIYQKSIIESHYNQLINILEKEFFLKLNNYELSYLKGLMIFNQKVFDDNLFFEIKNFISDLIFKKYYFSLTVENFNWTINSFLKENYLKLLFDFYKSFNFDSINNSLLFDDSYYYGWEILNIICFAFKKFHFNVTFNLFINDYFLAIFNNLYLWNSQKNWRIPLFYQRVSNSYYERNKVILFIKSKYPNIVINSLSLDHNIYEFNFLNQDYSILVHNGVALDLSQFKKIFPIEQNCLVSTQQLQKSIDLNIKMLMLNKICSSILIFDFFSNQKFYNIKTFLSFFQDFLIRKFKINWINFDLKEAFIYRRFFQKNILLIHKMVPINNVELPIILVYLKNPLFFSERNPIYFIFILITNSNTVYQYDWVISYLSIIKNNFTMKVNTVKKLYKILNEFVFNKNLEDIF